MLRMDFQALGRAKRSSINVALALLAIETVEHCKWSTYRGIQSVLGLNQRTAAIRCIQLAMEDGLVERMHHKRKAVIRLTSKARKALGLEQWT